MRRARAFSAIDVLESATWRITSPERLPKRRVRPVNTMACVCPGAKVPRPDWLLRPISEFKTHDLLLARRAVQPAALDGRSVCAVWRRECACHRRQRCVPCSAPAGELVVDPRGASGVSGSLRPSLTA